MKKIINITLLAISSVFLLTGCESISTWWKNLDFSTVATSLSPALQSVAKYTTYAVCKKNTDLNPIFNSAANGVLIAVNAGTFDTDSIKKYIVKALGEENKEWNAVVFTAMDSILNYYNAIYNKYWPKEELNPSADKLNGFKIILTSVATGIVDGTKMTTLASAPSYRLATSAETDKIKAEQNMNEKLKEFDITM